MFLRSPLRGAAVLALWAGLSALAASPPRPDPADPAAPVPPAVHRPAFRDHRPAADPPPARWPEANAHVGRIGGWRSYAREAAAPASGASR